MTKINIVLIIILLTFFCQSSVNSSQLNATRITPVFDTKITTGENIIYCSTFQTAWNEICNKYAQGTLEIVHAPEYAEKLNTLYMQPSLLNEELYIAMAGFGGDEIVKKINEAVENKFGLSKTGEMPPKFDFNLSSNEIMAFSYLYINLKFSSEFETIAPIRMAVDEKSFFAKAYGAKEINKNEKMKNNIEVLYHNDREIDEYRDQLGQVGIEGPQGSIIKLKTDSDKDELIISTIPASSSLTESYNEIQKIINDKLMQKTPKESALSFLSIPKIKFDFIHKYTEFNNLQLINKTFKKYYEDIFLNNCVQKIVFNFNIKDTKLLSETFTSFSTSEKGIIYYKINVQCPFIIYLRNKTKELPYFAAYITNDEVIEKQTIPKSNAEGEIDQELSLNPILCGYTEGDCRLNLSLNNQKYINLKSKDGSTTLLLAIKKRSYIYSKYLNFFIIHDPKGSNAEINSNSRISYNNLIIRLIKYGANINASDNAGNTPLTYAIENEDLEIVKILIKYGADIHIKRKDNKDAITLAKEKNNKEIINLINAKLKKGK